MFSIYDAKKYSKQVIYIQISLLNKNMKYIPNKTNYENIVKLIHISI